MDNDQQDEATQVLIGRLEQFLHVAGEKGKLATVRPTRSREVDDRLGRQLDSIRRICNEVKPGLGDFQDTTWTGSAKAKDAARTAVGILQDRRQLDLELRAAGLHTMPALELSSRVWESAKSLWSSDQLGEALLAAWRALNADVQQRLGRPDLSDAKLVNQAFGLEAHKPPRLHLPGDSQTETWKSRQRGLLHLAQTCVAGIRNPVAHDPKHPLPRAVAVEELTCLSLLAHWIDETELVTG